MSHDNPNVHRWYLLVITFLAASLGCSEVSEDQCPASYIKIRVGKSLLFIVDCKEELGSLTPEVLRALDSLPNGKALAPPAPYFQRVRMQTGGEERTTFCLMGGSKLERLDKDGSWSCLLLRGNEASAILFGPKSSLLTLNGRDLERVARELDRQVVAKGLALLGDFETASFRSATAAKLNRTVGRRICDDLFFRSFGVSEALP